MKTVLITDREYATLYMKSDVFKLISVALTRGSKRRLISLGIEVVACFEEEYEHLEQAEFDSDYLDHSFDSDRVLYRFPLQKRLEILGKEITFWRNVFDKYKPDVLVNEVVTLEYFEVMYIEARNHNVPYYCFLPNPIPHTIYWLETPYNSVMAFPEGNITQDIQNKADDFINNIVVRNQKPFYIQNINDNKLSLICDALRHVLICYKANLKLKFSKRFKYEDYTDLYSFKLESAVSLLYKSYDKLVFDDKLEYYFFPIHYEPEATVTYFADSYDDQVMMIGRFAHALSINQRLIVKEHPQQRGALLTTRYQNLKKKYKNIIFVESKITSYEIFKNIKAVITLTGTAGFEALVCGIPVILIGNVFYKNCSGVTFCNNFLELKDIFRNHRYQKPNKDEIKHFVELLFLKVRNVFPFKSGGKYIEEDIYNFTKEIEYILEK